MYRLLIIFSFFILIGTILFNPILFSYAFSKRDLPIVNDLSVQNPGGPNLIDTSLKLELISRGIKFPSDMAFLGPSDILILEKNTGLVKRFVNGSMAAEPLLDVHVANKGERGMLGIAIAKHNKGPTYVFLYFTQSASEDGEDAKGKGPLCNCLYRYEVADNKLINPKLLLNITAVPGGNIAYPDHIGGKSLIGRDQQVYITTGDVGSHRGISQNVENTLPVDGTSGILRISQYGKLPSPGILGHEAGLIRAYYAYGIRNSYGIDFDPVTNFLWDTENGPRFGDEINLVKEGFNSGWNSVQGIWDVVMSVTGSFLQGTTTFNPVGLKDFNGSGTYSSPEFISNHSMGLTTLKFLNSDVLGIQYENDMFVGDFHNGNIYRFELSKNRTELVFPDHSPLLDKIANTSKELKSVIFGSGFGGIIDLEVGPDGYLYILSLAAGGDDCIPRFNNAPCISYTSANPGSIFRVVPSKNYDFKSEEREEN